MTIVGHAPVRLAITVALAALIASLVPPFIDRRDYTAAVNAYVRNPTLQNGVVLAREHVKNRRLVLLTRLGAGTALFVVLNIAWSYASKQVRK
jgi:DTW domain-containing protein YfiP